MIKDFLRKHYHNGNDDNVAYSPLYIVTRFETNSYDLFHC